MPGYRKGKPKKKMLIKIFIKKLISSHLKRSLVRVKTLIYFNSGKNTSIIKILDLGKAQTIIIVFYIKNIQTGKPKLHKI